AFYFRSRSATSTTKATPLTEKDTVVLADFDNKTGDTVFDDALKQALAVQLGQSPFLNILSDRKVEETLHLMGRAPNERATRDVARELCIRTGSKAYLVGSVSKLGGQYVVGVDAVGCSSGDTLAKEQEEAASKENVLKALGKAAASLRGKLGESLATIQKFDVPVEATTPSQDAIPPGNLATIYDGLGQYEKALTATEESQRLEPDVVGYFNLAQIYLQLNRPDDARKTIEQAQAGKFEGDLLHWAIYQLAFL